MSKLKYIKGFIKHLNNPRISKLALVDENSLFHKSARICIGVKVLNGQINSFSYVGPQTEIVYATIGKFCSIGPQCIIGLALHSTNYISTSPIFTSKYNGTKYQWSENNSFCEYKPITIGNDVWIGSRSIVLGGVKIGNGVVIGAGAIVTKDIPDYAIAAGVPARIVKYRFEPAIIKRLLEIEWWNKSPEKLRESIQYFSKENLNIANIDYFNLHIQ